MSDGPGGDWALERPTGAVEELHAPVGPISGRVVIVNEVEAPTLVLGSSQAGVEVAPGLDVVRRSSGGGPDGTGPMGRPCLLCRDRSG